MLCTFLHRVSWEPVKASASREWSHGPAVNSHHLLSAGDSREPVHNTQLIRGLLITVPNLGCFLGAWCTWPLTCVHVCLPPSQLALDYGIKFMETSAKANINVENVSPRPTALAP